jgi:pimeloyl-ACP methyl ester carboxylesterase
MERSDAMGRGKIRKVKSRDGTSIAYDLWGEGAPLIIVDGAFSHRTHPWSSRLTELLASRFAVINYDRRGRRDSGFTPPYAVEREIEDLEALAGEASSPPYVFGMSTGAALALEFASRGRTIGGLAVFEPPYMVDDHARQRMVGVTERVNELVGSGRRIEAVDLFMVEAVAVPANDLPATRQDPFWEGMDELAHTIVYDLEIMGDFSIPKDLLSKIVVPTLVLDGEVSNPNLRLSARAVSDGIAGAQRVTLRNQGHDVSPEVLAPALVDFFARLSSTNCPSSNTHARHPIP